MKLIHGYTLAVVSVAYSLGSARIFALSDHSFHDHGSTQQDGTIHMAKDEIQPIESGRKLKGQGMDMRKMNMMNGGMNIKGSPGSKGSSKTARPTLTPTARPTLKPTTAQPSTIIPTTVPSWSPSSAPSIAPTFVD